MPRPAGGRTIGSMHTETDIPVLVVGAGPAGLAAAIELARREIPTLLVERRLALSSHPRATALSLRSMELMRSWGLEAQVRARSADVDWRMLRTETLADAPAGEAVQVGFPSPEQAGVLSPTAPACIAQDDVEPILLAHLRSHEHARVQLGVEVTAASADGHVVLRDVCTGGRRTVHAGFVVAADGARSAVRRAVGIRMAGAEGVLEGVTTLIRSPLWHVVGPHRHVLYSATIPDAPGTFLPAGPGDRWLYGAAEDDRPVADLIRLGAGVPDLPVRVEGSRRFSSAAQLAESFNRDRVFLAGDAAHRVTPRGGMGLNIALQGGYDLGWKLAWVLRGWAREALLDSYEAERRPVAEHTAARSADPAGSRRTPGQELHADLGGRITHAWSGGRSTLDLLGPGMTLFAGRDDTGWEAVAAASRLPVTVRRVDPLAAAAVGAVGRAAVLVRPDGRPAALYGTTTSFTPGDERWRSQISGSPSSGTRSTSTSSLPAAACAAMVS
jgi:putative polyketide hydroxylase